MEPKRETQLKYSDAVKLYADTNLPIREICEITHISFAAFSSYLSKYHRDLILKRHNLTGFKSVRLRGKRGQTTAAHYKYLDAIQACDNIEYIEYNVSQIARIFDVDPCSLLGQLRKHYPDIVPRRENERKRMGITINLQYGARKWTKNGYAKAVEMLQTGDMTIEEVANECEVSPTGLREHLLIYHPQVVEQREKKRNNVVGRRVRGERMGNWQIHAPEDESIVKYEEAVRLYRETSMDVKQIVKSVGVTIGAFRHHLRTWHTDLMVERRGFDSSVDFSKTKRYKKSTVEKYADAIERLRISDLPTAKVAAEYGLNPETFRMYLKEHHPELVKVRGMVKAENGRTVAHRSEEKYKEAIRLYETTDESLKSIAKRLGIQYNSIGGYIRRNYPEAIEKHNSLLENMGVRFAEGIARLQNSNATINAVMQELGYNEYFRQYIKTKYPELLNRETTRKKITGTKVAARKYAEAMEQMRTTTDTMKDICARLGVNIDSFRKYISKHAPELMRRSKK